jgi:hypothetical protein
MAYTIRRVDYFYASVDDRPGEAGGLLSQLANLGVNLLAFTAIPIGPQRTRLTLFPESSSKLLKNAQESGLVVDGPHRALLVQGDDELGALARIHERLSGASINVYASTGVADGRGSFGYVIYVRQEDYELAANALEI